jgi:hypothetical protein
MLYFRVVSAGGVQTMTVLFRNVVCVFGIFVIAALVNFAPMLTLRMPGMEEYSFYGMRVVAKPSDKADAERVAARIEKQAGTVAAALGITQSTEIGVIVYPSRKDLHRKTIGFAGAFLPDWFIGDNTHMGTYHFSCQSRPFP